MKFDRYIALVEQTDGIDNAHNRLINMASPAVTLHNPMISLAQTQLLATISYDNIAISMWSFVLPGFPITLFFFFFLFFPHKVVSELVIIFLLDGSR